MVVIVVALGAVSVVSVVAFAGKGEEGATAAEQDSVQAAVDTLTAVIFRSRPLPPKMLPVPEAQQCRTLRRYP